MQIDDISNKFTYFSFGLYGLFMGIEYIVTKIQNKKNYKLKDTAVNLATGLFALYLPFLIGMAIFAVLYNCLKPYAFFELPKIWINLFRFESFHWVLLAALFLLDDFCYYCYHRTSHTVRLLWCIHEMHHSSEELNFSVYFRASFLEYIFQGIFWVPLILLGFSLEDILFQMSVSLFYQFWLHTKFTKNIFLFDFIFNVPRFHRVHHSKNIPYLDKNHGAVFIIWDRLFGTFKEEKEEPIYGVLAPVNSFNLITLNFSAFRSLWSDISNCNSGIVSKISYVLAPPGWRHDGTGKTTKTLQKLEVLKTN